MHKTAIKLLSLILVAPMMFITVLAIAISPMTVSAAIGEPDTSWYAESLNNFVISTVDELAGLAELVNDGTDDFYEKNYYSFCRH